MFFHSVKTNPAVKLHQRHRSDRDATAHISPSLFACRSEALRAVLWFFKISLSSARSGFLEILPLLRSWYASLMTLNSLSRRRTYRDDGAWQGAIRLANLIRVFPNVARTSRALSSKRNPLNVISIENVFANVFILTSIYGDRHPALRAWLQRTGSRRTCAGWAWRQITSAASAGAERWQLFPWI